MLPPVPGARQCPTNLHRSAHHGPPGAGAAVCAAAAVVVRVAASLPGTPCSQRQQATADIGQHVVVHIDRFGTRPPPEREHVVDELLRNLFGDEFPDDGVADVTGFLGPQRC
jgi:hypothetical protein